MTYRPLHKSLTIKDSNIEGLGLFAIEDIPANTNLGISHVKDSRFPDELIRTPLGGFFNHSTAPNCRVETDDSHFMQVGLVSLFTNVDLKEGDELTTTYSLYDPS